MKTLDSCTVRAQRRACFLERLAQESYYLSCGVCIKSRVRLRRSEGELELISVLLQSDAY
jgi:hypothetical protein